MLLHIICLFWWDQLTKSKHSFQKFVAYLFLSSQVLHVLKYFQREHIVLQVLAVIQIAMEGALSSATVCSNIGRGKRAAGDLLPWTVSQQFMVGCIFYL